MAKWNVDRQFIGEAERTDKIVVDRQALLDVVRALDLGITGSRLPHALDTLREPFFPEEMSSGRARLDGKVNSYD